MPRGVAIPEARQQLFAALERVITAQGPGRLTSRAVTGEADVANGLLFAHFANFDDFLVGYAVDRSFQLASTVAGLPARAGTGTVAGNLSEAVLTTPPGTLAATTRLLAYRPGLSADVEAVLGDGRAGLRTLEAAVAAYLAAEQQRGRVPDGADTEALAVTVVSVVHYVALTEGTDPQAGTRISRTLAALFDSFPAVAS